MRFVSGDYKAKFNDAVTELVAAKIPDRSERMAAVDALINEYMQDTGKLPDDKQIERLTDAILMEELTDMHPDKVTRNEYPFLSEWQFDRRRSDETKLEAADDQYRTPKRRKRSNWENERIDKTAKIRNKERKEQYRNDTMTIDYPTWQASPEALEAYLIDKYGEWKLKYSP